MVHTTNARAMHANLVSRTRSAVTRVLTHRDDCSSSFGQFSLLLGCLLLLVWSYFTYMHWPASWPAPLRPILKIIGWIWMAVG
jgi:hypothetical protein